jgi:hypothetical protein
MSKKHCMHLCMQDEQNGPNIMVLSSADMARLTCFIVSIFYAEANTIAMNLLCFLKTIVRFFSNSYSIYFLCIYGCVIFILCIYGCLIFIQDVFACHRRNMTKA